MRSKWEIFLDILKAVSETEKCKKTRIKQEIGLDWNRTTKHFEHLIERGFIEKKSESYIITGEGEELLKNLQKIKRTLERNS